MDRGYGAEQPAPPSPPCAYDVHLFLGLTRERKGAASRCKLLAAPLDHAATPSVLLPGAVRCLSSSAMYRARASASRCAWATSSAVTCRGSAGDIDTDTCSSSTWRIGGWSV